MSSDMPSSVPGSIAGLLSLLNSTTPEELADAADNVQSIAQDKATKDMVREAGGIPLLAKALQQDGSLQQQAAVGALQNLCRGNQQNKNAMREADVIQPLVEIVAAGFVSARRRMWTAMPRRRSRRSRRWRSLPSKTRRMARPWSK